MMAEVTPRWPKMALNGPKTVNCSTSTMIRYLGARMLHANLRTRMRNCARKRARARASKGQNDSKRSTRIQLHRYTGTRIHPYAHACANDAHVMRTCMRTCMHTCMRTCMRECIRACTNTLVHKYPGTLVHRYPCMPVHK